MASYLRPRRGKKSTAEAQLTASAPLKRGEVFFEVPADGVGTGLGNIKMGDGTTAYASLPYFLSSDTGAAKVAFTNTTAADTNPYTTNATYVGNVIPTNTLATIFTNIKKLLLNHNSQLTTLNNDLNGLSFAQNTEGKWGYKPSGADTVIPFSSNTNGTLTIIASATLCDQREYAWVWNNIITAGVTITITVTIKDGNILSRKISGGNVATSMHEPHRDNYARCYITNFSIISVTFVPET